MTFLKKTLLMMAARGDKRRYLRRMGMRIGNNVDLYNRVSDYGSEPWLIEIGHDVTVAAGVVFVTHDGSSRLFRRTLPGASPFGNRFGPVTIKNNCFIGVNSILMPGVTVGPNSVVGAGSLVTRDVPAGCVVLGSPARFHCSLEAYRDKYLRETVPVEARDERALRRELAVRFWKEER